MRLPKLQYDENSQDVILVRKTPLIAKVNNWKLKLINNESYTITKIDVDNQEITIQNDRNEITIESSEFQKLYSVGYSFTIHACQGMSIETPYTIWEWERLNKKLNMSHLVGPSGKNTWILNIYIYILSNGLRNFIC